MTKDQEMAEIAGELIAARREYAEHPTRHYAMVAQDIEAEYLEIVTPDRLLDLLERVRACEVVHEGPKITPQDARDVTAVSGINGAGQRVADALFVFGRTVP